MINFFDNFDTLTDAPNGVAKLRELILQLAVRGELVAQNPKDERVGELLREVQVEKRWFLAENKLKVSATQSAVGTEEAPFSCPTAWHCVRLGAISNRIHYGYTASADPLLRAVRLLRITDIQNNWVNWESVPGCQILDADIPKYELHDGDILFARTGGTIGKTFLVDNLDVKAVFASYLIRAIPSSRISARYLKLFLESPCYWEQLWAKSMGTGQPNVNGEALANLAVPLPPLPEQHRIVAKVDKLMTLCDELEARQRERREVRIRLHASAINRLLTARKPKEFSVHWRRIRDHFDLLHDTPETIPQLRQAILQLAVQGKLVPQDAEDEPAISLLERVGMMREKIAREDKLRLPDPDGDILGDELPVELPSGWTWTRLGAIALKLGAGSTPLGGKRVYEKTGIKFLRSQNVWNNGLRLDDVAFIPERVHRDRQGTVVEPGDILLNITGASIGRSALVPDDFDEANVSQHVTIVRLADKSLRHFLHLCMIAPSFQETIMAVQVGVSREGLSMNRLKEFVVPLPPLPEQHRIVVKVDKLMALCDELEARLTQGQALNQQLLESTVHHLLTGEVRLPEFVGGKV